MDLSEPFSRVSTPIILLHFESSKAVVHAAIATA